MALDQETLDQLLQAVERFVTDRLIPAETLVAEQDRVPDEIVQDMRELGLFGLTIPTEFGGLGLSLSEECEVIRRLGRTSPAFRSVIGTTVGIGSQGIVMFGTPEQKAEWLPRLAAGEAVASFALTEPDAGSDAAHLKTVAVRDGDFYVLNGTKRYITNAKIAGMFTVMARTGDSKSGASGVTAFIVPAGVKGLSIGKPEKKMGQQGAHIYDVIFEDCRVPAANVLLGEGQGFRLAMSVLDRGRIHVAALCVGMAERLIEEMARYALQRKQFGEPIANFQLVQAMIADSQTDTYAAQTMIMDAARRRDAGENTTMQAACCKYFCSEMVGRVADRAVQIFGGSGYVADAGIERFYRDCRIFRIYEGTSQIQQLVIAKHVLRQWS